MILELHSEFQVVLRELIEELHLNLPVPAVGNDGGYIPNVIDFEQDLLNFLRSCNFKLYSYI